MRTLTECVIGSVVAFWIGCNFIWFVDQVWPIPLAPTTPNCAVVEYRTSHLSECNNNNGDWSRYPGRGGGGGGLGGLLGGLTGGIL